MKQISSRWPIVTPLWVHWEPWGGETLSALCLQVGCVHVVGVQEGGGVMKWMKSRGSCARNHEAQFILPGGEARYVVVQVGALFCTRSQIYVNPPQHTHTHTCHSCSQALSVTLSFLSLTRLSPTLHLHSFQSFSPHSPALCQGICCVFWLTPHICVLQGETRDKQEVRLIGWAQALLALFIPITTTWSSSSMQQSLSLSHMTKSWKKNNVRPTSKLYCLRWSLPFTIFFDDFAFASQTEHLLPQHMLWYDATALWFSRVQCLSWLVF